MGFYDTPPTIRADCISQPRPCPWIRCKHHMIWACIEKRKKTFYGWTKKDHKMRVIKDNDIINMIFTLKQTCVLDIADKGVLSLQKIGDILGLTKERIRQIEDWKNDRSGRRGAIQKLRMPKRIAMLD